MAYLRRRSRPQNDRQIEVQRKNFTGGMSLDLPASELNKDVVQNIENFVANDRYLDGRSGSVEVDSLPGTGTVHSVFYHPTENVRVIHRGSKLYRFDIALAASVDATSNPEILDFAGASFGIDADSTIKEFGNDAIIFTASGIFQIGIKSDYLTKRFWKLNGSRPNYYVIHGDDTKAYQYRYIVTYSQILRTDTLGYGNAATFGDRTDTGVNLVHETGHVLEYDLSTYAPKFEYGARGFDSPLGTGDATDYIKLVSGTNVATVADRESTTDNTNKDVGYTHWSIYRTLDLGTNGVNSEGVVNNSEVYTWVHDIPFTALYSAAGAPHNVAGATYITLYTTAAFTPRIHPAIGTSAESVNWKVTITQGTYTETKTITAISNTQFTIDTALLYTYTAGTITAGRSGDSGVSRQWMDNVSDNVLRSRMIAKAAGSLGSGYFALRTRGCDAIPSGDIGEFTGDWLLTGNRGKKEVYYNSTPDAYLSGFHNAGFQREEMDDGVQSIEKGQYQVNFFCKGKTAILNTKSFTDSNAGGAFPIFTLTGLTLADPKTGVLDYGSIARVDQNGFLAVTSDNAVRYWDGGQWGKDYAWDLVRTEIEKIVPGRSKGIFYKGAYYLFYSKDYADTTCGNCLRLSVKRESGNGWSFYTGSAWVKTPFATGLYIGAHRLNAGIGTANQNLEMFHAIDGASAKDYWIETFNAPTGFKLLIYNAGAGTEYAPVKTYTDKKIVASNNLATGTSIACKVKDLEQTAEREYYNLIHAETRPYIREITNATETATLAIDANAYVEGSSTSSELVGKVIADGEIHFYRRIEGNRIALEFTTNRSAVQVTGWDSIWREQDRKKWKVATADTSAGTYQQDWQAGVEHWLTRPNIYLNRGTGQNLSSYGLTTGTAPDGRSLSLDIGKGPITITNTKIFTDEFTYSACLGTISVAAADTVHLFTITGTGTYDSLSAKLLSATALGLYTYSTAIGTVTMTDLSATGPIEGYHHIAIVRPTTSSIMSIYQNNALKGTITYNGDFGGDNLILGG